MTRFLGVSLSHSQQRKYIKPSGVKIISDVLRPETFLRKCNIIL
jgi:hypothetical protein